jgi:hypothetical protein
MKIFQLAGVFAICCALGCGSKAPDKEMTSSPLGMWIGKTRTDASLDIQGDGSVKIAVGKLEQLGTWKLKGASLLEVTLSNGVFEMPFNRKDLILSIRLPGESTATEFQQM